MCQLSVAFHSLCLTLGGKLTEKVKSVVEDNKLLAALSRCSDESHSALNRNAPTMHVFFLQ